MNVVEVNELYKYYGKARGILDVSFVIPQGMIFGFIGPNGAGKSTTIRILLSLIHSSSGQAKVFGMRRAGAQLLITYFAPQAARWIRASDGYSS